VDVDGVPTTFFPDVDTDVASEGQGPKTALLNSKGVRVLKYSSYAVRSNFSSENVVLEPSSSYTTELVFEGARQEGPGPARFFIRFAFGRSQRSGRIGSAMRVGRTVWVDEVERAVGLEPGLKLPCSLDQLRLGSSSRLVSTLRRSVLLLVLIAGLTAGLKVVLWADLTVGLIAGLTADLTADLTAEVWRVFMSNPFSFIFFS
jgi:hypothetical protein